VKPKSVALACALLAAVACGRGDTEPDLDLASNGYIKISGGCECYAEALITFRPVSDDAVEVEVDNARAWFYKDNEPLKSFTVKMAADEAGEFFGDLKAVLDNPRNAETTSTRAAVVEIYLPFKDGKAVETTWRELDTKQDVNPLVDLLEEFVEECGEEA
jgi:hypothetical protein